MEKIRNIFEYSKRKDICIYFLVAALSVAMSTLFAMSLQPVIDLGMAGDIKGFVNKSILAVLFCILDVVFSFWDEKQRLIIKLNYIKQLRLEYFDRFFEQRTAYFLNKDSTAHLTKLTTDVEVIAEKYCENFLKIYKSICSLIVSFIAICSARIELAIYIVLFAFVSTYLPKLFQNKSDFAEEQYLIANNDFYANALENIQNYVLIKICYLFKRQKNRYSQFVNEVKMKDEIRQKREFLIDTVASGISELSFVLIVVFAMVLVLRGLISVGYIMSVSQLLGGIMFPFEMLPGYIIGLNTGYNVFRKNSIELGECSDTKGTDTVKICKNQSRICIQNVEFSYQDQRPIITDINISFDLNKKYALVGESGSGKSTLAQIIMGFLYPDKGQICIDNNKFINLHEDQKYKILSYQGQKVTFLNDTIRNNILLGKVISPLEFEEVLKCANIYDMVENLPNKADTIIEENGKNFSGGEAQKISFARYLVNKPMFMIFDEITSSLDSHNAKEIEQTILSVQNKGVLMITHRLYSDNMKKYDEIFVLKKGKIIERGTWTTLMQKKGEFYRLSNEFNEDLQGIVGGVGVSTNGEGACSGKC